MSSEEKLMGVSIQSLKAGNNGKIFIVLENGHIYRFENFNKLVEGIVEKSTILGFQFTHFEVTKHYAYLLSKKSKLHILDINTLEILKSFNDIKLFASTDNYLLTLQAEDQTPVFSLFKTSGNHSIKKYIQSYPLTVKNVEVLAMSDSFFVFSDGETYKFIDLRVSRLSDITISNTHIPVNKGFVFTKTHNEFIFSGPENLVISLQLPEMMANSAPFEAEGDLHYHNGQVYIINKEMCSVLINDSMEIIELNKTSLALLMDDFYLIYADSRLCSVSLKSKTEILFDQLVEKGQKHEDAYQNMGDFTYKQLTKIRPILASFYWENFETAQKQKFYNCVTGDSELTMNFIKQGLNHDLDFNQFEMLLYLCERDELKPFLYVFEFYVANFRNLDREVIESISKNIDFNSNVHHLMHFLVLVFEKRYEMCKWPENHDIDDIFEFMFKIAETAEHQNLLQVMNDKVFEKFVVYRLKRVNLLDDIASFFPFLSDKQKTILIENYDSLAKRDKEFLEEKRVDHLLKIEAYNDILSKNHSLNSCQRIKLESCLPFELLLQYYKTSHQYDHAFSLLKTESTPDIINTLTNFALSLPEHSLRTTYLIKILFEECVTTEETIKFLESNSSYLSPCFCRILKDIPEISSVRLKNLKNSINSLNLYLNNLNFYANL